MWEGTIQIGCVHPQTPTPLNSQRPHSAWGHQAKTTVLFFEEGEAGNSKVQTNVPQSRDAVGEKHQGGHVAGPRGHVEDKEMDGGQITWGGEAKERVRFHSDGKGKSRVGLLGFYKKEGGNYSWTLEKWLWLMCWEWEGQGQDRKGKSWSAGSQTELLSYFSCGWLDLLLPLGSHFVFKASSRSSLLPSTPTHDLGGGHRDAQLDSGDHKTRPGPPLQQSLNPSPWRRPDFRAAPCPGQREEFF